MHMLAFETIANLVSVAVIAGLGAIYWYGKRHSKR